MDRWSDQCLPACPACRPVSILWPGCSLCFFDRLIDSSIEHSGHGNFLTSGFIEHELFNLLPFTYYIFSVQARSLWKLRKPDLRQSFTWTTSVSRFRSCDFYSAQPGLWVANSQNRRVYAHTFVLGGILLRNLAAEHSSIL